MAKFIFEKYNARIYWDKNSANSAESVSNYMEGNRVGYTDATLPNWATLSSGLPSEPSGTRPKLTYYNFQGGDEWITTTYMPEGYRFPAIGGGGSYPDGATVYEITDTYITVGEVRYSSQTIEWNQRYLLMAPVGLIYKHGQIGTKIGNVIGEDTQYPIDGLHTDNFYYKRLTLNETATLTYPIGGESFNKTHNITWTKSSSDTTVDIEYYTGSVWKNIGIGVSGTSVDYDFTNETETSIAKVRVRPRLEADVGNWFISGTFSILHNIPPTKPVVLSVPALIAAQNAVITWSASYDADGDTIKYFLERSINGGSFTVVVNGLGTLTFTDSILTSWNTVRYQVRAYDSRDYSGYNTSTLRTVITRPPTIPSTITVPPLRGGETALITWGTSTQPDGRAVSYYLERSINGGGYSTIANGIGNTQFTDTILLAWNSARYRVRAYDSRNYSGYRESELLIVQQFPDFKLRIVGVLKDSDNGWVRINGELKQISSITVKVNGVLKEV